MTAAALALPFLLWLLVYLPTRNKTFGPNTRIKEKP